MPDTNTMAGRSGGNTQWFYFGVTNMRNDVEYKFNIVNLVKPDSLYNVGARPLIFSAMAKGSWRRVGERIAYYENQYETEAGQPYYTLTFTLMFPHPRDVCYLAHCYPYGYSDLSACLGEILGRPSANKHVQVSLGCVPRVGGWGCGDLGKGHTFISSKESHQHHILSVGSGADTRAWHRCLRCAQLW